MLDDKMKNKCHTIIHGAATAAGIAGAGLAQIPLADAVPITAIQVGMIIALGKVFDVELTEAAAKGLLGGFATTTLGRNIAGALVGWVPGIGNVIKAGTAGALTEAIGWATVNHFNNLENDRKNHFNYGINAGEKKAIEKMKEIIESLKNNDYFLMSIFVVSYYLTEDIKSNLSTLQKIFTSVETFGRLEIEFSKNVDKQDLFGSVKKYLVKLDEKGLKKMKEVVKEFEKLEKNIEKTKKEIIYETINKIITLNIVIDKNDLKREEKILSMLEISL